MEGTLFFSLPLFTPFNFIPIDEWAHNSFHVFFSLFPVLAHGIPVLRPGIEPTPPALEAQCPNHWTAREVPSSLLFKHNFLSQDCHRHLTPLSPLPSHLPHSHHPPALLPPCSHSPSLGDRVLLFYFCHWWDAVLRIRHHKVLKMSAKSVCKQYFSYISK